MTTRTRDYAAMTDEQLNRLVAERLGWQLITGFSSLYRLPDGTTGNSNDEAWASSIDAAAALDFGDAILTIVIRSGSPVEVEVMTVRGGSLVIAAANMARAITEAWALYRDAMESREAGT